MRDVHILPLADDGSALPGKHTASQRCRGGPLRSFCVMSTGAVAWRHRAPAARVRSEPGAGEGFPVPPRESLPGVLGRVLDASTPDRTPSEVADASGASLDEAVAALARLRSWGCIP